MRYLVRMIDDAMSWSWGRFVESDATPQNMGVLWEYLEKNGRMVDVYTDRASMFTVPPRPGEKKEQQRVAAKCSTSRRSALGATCVIPASRIGLYPLDKLLTNRCNPYDRPAVYVLSLDEPAIVCLFPDLQPSAWSAPRAHH